jgi:alpha-N-arabinofuranosidase
MANIAQTVNVLQAMILTDGKKMLLTPTYHVFEMFKVHHDSTRLPVMFSAPEYKFRDRSMPALSVSASRDKDGRVHVSIVNVHATQPIKLSCELPGVEASVATGRVLTAQKLDAHNTFDEPERVRPQEFESARLDRDKLQFDIPPRSVLVLNLTK